MLSPRAMATYVALLRAVNLGGATEISMRSLTEAARHAGFTDVVTLGRSGNLVVRGPVRTPERVGRDLQEALQQGRGPRTECFVRTSAEWDAAIRGNPFPAMAKADPSHLTMNVLRDAPSLESWAALRARVTGREQIAEAGRHAYIVYPDGIGRSRLTLALLERTLGTTSTARNWNTVLKLRDLAGAWA